MFNWTRFIVDTLHEAYTNGEAVVFFEDDDDIIFDLWVMYRGNIYILN